MKRGGECQQKLSEIIEKDVNKHKPEQKMSGTQKPLEPV
jgi:hypothetical protein